MPIRRPYYGLHQIVLGQYTPGNEYVLDDGTDYIGAYHVLPNSQLYTGARPTTDSREMFEKRVDIAEDVKRYNRLLNIRNSQYVSPISFQPRPNADDYEFGEIQRYFVQKRNNPLATIVEIDGDQFNAINVANSPGINGVLWNSTIFPWKISIISPEDAAELNRRELIKAERKFRGIGIFVRNVLEFYK